MSRALDRAVDAPMRFSASDSTGEMAHGMANGVDVGFFGGCGVRELV